MNTPAFLIYQKTIDEMNELGKKAVPFLFIIDFEMLQPQIFLLRNIDAEDILYDINGFCNHQTKSIFIRSLIFKKYPVDYKKYLIAYNHVRKNLVYGNSFLLNLTFPTRIETNYCLKDFFFASTAKYKLFYKDKFVVFSPESFIKINNGKIYAYPMKGTIDANLPNASQQILNNEKEKAEHATIVDLIRNDISMVASDVIVEKYRYIERINTCGKDLLQVSSEITGVLPLDYQTIIGDILFTLLPAGSISGAPKRRTVDIIKEAECFNRNFYTGVFGYFDGQNLDCGVIIRFIEKTSNNNLFYRSGGGITVYSKAEEEYAEMIDKVYVPVT